MYPAKDRGLGVLRTKIHGIVTIFQLTSKPCTPPIKVVIGVTYNNKYMYINVDNQHRLSLTTQFPDQWFEYWLSGGCACFKLKGKYLGVQDDKGEMLTDIFWFFNVYLMK